MSEASERSRCSRSSSSSPSSLAEMSSGPDHADHCEDDPHAFYTIRRDYPGVQSYFLATEPDATLLQYGFIPCNIVTNQPNYFMWKAQRKVFDNVRVSSAFLGSLTFIRQCQAFVTATSHGKSQFQLGCMHVILTKP